MRLLIRPMMTESFSFPYAFFLCNYRFHTIGQQVLEFSELGHRQYQMLGFKSLNCFYGCRMFRHSFFDYPSNLEDYNSSVLRMYMVESKGGAIACMIFALSSWAHGLLQPSYLDCKMTSLLVVLIIT